MRGSRGSPSLLRGVSKATADSGLFPLPPDLTLRGSELESDLFRRPEVVAIGPMLGQFPPDDPEEMDVLHRVGPTCRFETHEHSPVYWNLRSGGMHAVTGRPYCDPVSFRDHLMKCVSLAQRVQALVNLREGCSIGSPAMIE